MNDSDPVRPSRGWRRVVVAVAGIVAGAFGVAAVRIAVGPDARLVGALVGVASLGAGMALAVAISGRHRRRAAAGHRRPGGRLRTRVHPLAWAAPVAGSVLAVLAWSGVAHSSGSGWVQAVGALLAAVLLTGLVAPLFPARRAAASCIANPSDVEAGQAAELTVTTNGPVRIRALNPAGATAQAGGRTRGARSVVVTVTPERRGVVEQVDLELASCAPFGLLWWAREVEVRLPRPLHVAPRLGPPTQLAAGVPTTRLASRPGGCPREPVSPGGSAPSKPGTRGGRSTGRPRRTPAR